MAFLEFMARGWWEFFIGIIVLSGIWILLYDSMLNICNAIKKR